LDRDGTPRLLAVGISRSDGKDTRVSEFRRRVVLAITPRLPALQNHVLHIGGRCVRKEMGWANTRRVIAVVADVETIGDGPIVQPPCNTVRPLAANASVAIARGSRPDPAPTKLRAVRGHWAMLVHLGPEAINEWLWSQPPTCTTAIPQPTSGVKGGATRSAGPFGCQLADSGTSGRAVAIRPRASLREDEPARQAGMLRGHHDLHRGVTPPDVDASRGLRRVSILPHRPDSAEPIA
jgi:hypothetical protein